MGPYPTRSDKKHSAVKAVSLAAVFIILGAPELAIKTTKAYAAGLGKLVIQAGSPDEDTGKAGRVLSIFTDKCSECHSGASNKGDFGFITNLDQLGKSSKYINTCSAKASLLWNEINEDSDLAGHQTLTSKEKSEIITWIEAQAPGTSENDGRQSIGPLSVYKMIQEDLDSFEKIDRKQIRYLSLVNLYNAGDKVELIDRYQSALIKLTTALSSASGENPVKPIGNDNLIMRINLAELGWSAAKWEALTRFSPYQIYPDNITYDFIRQDTGANIPVLRGDWFAYAASEKIIANFLMDLPTTEKTLNACLKSGSDTQGTENRKDNVQFVHSLSGSSASSSSVEVAWSDVRSLVNRYEKTICVSDAAAEFGISRKGLKWLSQAGTTRVQQLNVKLNDTGIDRSRFEDEFIELAALVNSSSGISPVGSIRAASLDGKDAKKRISTYLKNEFPEYGTLDYCRNQQATGADQSRPFELSNTNGYYLTYASAPYQTGARSNNLTNDGADTFDRTEALQVAKTLARAKIALKAAVRPETVAAHVNVTTAKISSLNDAVNYLGALNGGFPFREQWQSEQNNSEITVRLRARLRDSHNPAQRIDVTVVPQVLSDQQSLTIQIKGLLDSAVAIYAWQADDTVIRLYPQSDDEVLGIKAGKFYQLPQSGDHINDLKVRPMPGSRGNHEAIVALASGSLQDISSLAPGIAAAASQGASQTTSEFLNRISELPVGSYQLSFRPYQVLASD